MYIVTLSLVYPIFLMIGPSRSQIYWAKPKKIMLVAPHPFLRNFKLNNRYLYMKYFSDNRLSRDFKCFTFRREITIRTIN